MAFQYVGLGIQGADGYNSLSSVTLADGSFDRKDTLNTVAGTSTALNVATGIATQYMVSASANGTLDTKITALAKASGVVGAVGGGANIVAFWDDANKAIAKGQGIEGAQTGVALNAASGLFAVGVGAAIVIAPEALVAIGTLNALSLAFTAIGLASGSDTIGSDLAKLSSTLKDFFTISPETYNTLTPLEKSRLTQLDNAVTTHNYTGLTNVDGFIQYTGDKTTVMTEESYDSTGTKTSTTVSAYSNTGDLLGRSSSEHAIGDFIAVPNANSPASVIETLQQTTANSIGSATQALNVATMVGLDKNNGADSAWLTTLNSPVTTVVNVRSSGGYSNPYSNSYPNYGSFGFGGFDNFSFSWSSQSNCSSGGYGSGGGYSISYCRPIAFDLDGDGVELTSLGNSHAWFDVTGDGTKHQTGWIGADDGLLAFDENGDGKITTAKEIAFASRTSADDTDMEALASEFDTNHDGQLNASDAQFSTFRVWKDANGNGETDAGELMTLAQAGVASVGLVSNGASYSMDGNTISGFSTYTKTDGTTGAVADAAFQYDTTGYTTIANNDYTKVTQSGGSSYAVATGNALNLTLTSAGVDGVVGSGGNDILNATGKTTTVNLEGGAGNDVLTGGSGNDWLKGGSGSDTLNGGDGNDTLVMDGADAVSNINGGNGFDTMIVEGSTGVTMDLYARNIEAAVGGDGNDTFSTSGTGRVVLSGRGGNDTLKGNANGDILDGGIGNDTLQGAGGDDVYLFNKGDGADTISEYQTQTINTTTREWVSNGKWSGSYKNITRTTTKEINAGNDTIQLGNEITLSDLDLERLGSDLVLAIRGGQDTATAITSLVDRLTIKDFSNTNRTIENITFSDGTSEKLASWIVGTAGNDTLNGTGANDRLFGGDGNDALNGGAGNDFINGGIGDDSINGGTGLDTMRGGQGNDIYVVDNIGDIVVENANEGMDTVLSAISYVLGDNVENLTLTGNANINATGNALNNILQGNSGNNILTGGVGNDIYVVDNIGDIVVENTNEGIDTVVSSSSYTLGDNIENLTLSGTSNINATGNALNNTLQGNSASNILSGGLGNDTYVVDSLGDTIVENTNGGNDTVVSSITYTLGDNVENLTLSGTANISGTGNSMDNILIGNDGNNTLSGGIGSDTMRGGLGNDTYIMNDLEDMILENSNEGLDTVLSQISYVLGDNVENVTLSGNTNINATGNDLNNGLTGNSGNNVLNGGLGNDTLAGTGGNDIYLFGKGSGADTISDVQTQQVAYTYQSWVSSGKFGRRYVTNTEYRTEDINAGNDTIQIGNEITLSDLDLERLGSDLVLAIRGGQDTATALTSLVDRLTIKDFTNANRTIENITFSDGASERLGSWTIGTAGNDTLTGSTGNDRLFGGDGNDTIDGGIGADFMSGGFGNDTYIVDNKDDMIVEFANSGVDSVTSSVSYALGSNIENLTLGGSSNINATGNSQNNILTGNTGTNTLDGGAGNDTLFGGSGNDAYLFGKGSGTDTISDYQTQQVAYTYGTWVSSGKFRVFVTQTGYKTEDVNAGADTLRLGDGVTFNDLDLERSGSDLIVAIREGGDTKNISLLSDKAILKDYSAVGSRAIENIVIGSDPINNLASWSVGTASADTLSGTSSDDILFGGSGNDVLSGGAGNDRLSGGLGNDTLNGGIGNDDYYFNRGGGTDTIIDNDISSPSNDEIYFGKGIDSAQLWFKHQGNDLEIDIIGTTDSLSIKNWYLGENNQVETFHTADNKQLLNSDVEKLVQAMAAFAPPVAGEAMLAANVQTALAPTLAANWK